jgi:hypothetical protein
MQCGLLQLCIESGEEITIAGSGFVIVFTEREVLEAETLEVGWL